MLEDHALAFLKNWSSGFGRYGEQGMETLHASMNSLTRAYVSMPNATERLIAVMKEHYMRTNPCRKQIRISPRKRKFKE